jgi:hypothetical protein
MTNEQQRSPIFCLDKVKKHHYNTIWGIKPLLMVAVTVTPAVAVAVAVTKLAGEKAAVAAAVVGCR